MKKLSMVLLSSFLLVACADEEKGKDAPEEPDDENVTEIEDIKDEEDDEDDIVEANEDENNEMEKSGNLEFLGEQMAENSFVNEFGVEALENYLEIDEQLTYINYDEENGFMDEGGSTKEEVIAAIDSVIEDSVYDISEDEDEDITSITLYYLNPDEPEQDGEEAEIMNYGDVSFLFQNDNLYLSNVAPGWYELQMEDLVDAEAATDIANVEELPELIDDPQFFTLGKMNLNNQELVQVMIPAMLESEGENNLLAMYLYFSDDETVFANYIPFPDAATNFPVHGVLAINNFLEEVYQ